MDGSDGVRKVRKVVRKVCFRKVFTAHMSLVLVLVPPALKEWTSNSCVFADTIVSYMWSKVQPNNKSSVQLTCKLITKLMVHNNADLFEYVFNTDVVFVLFLRRLVYDRLFLD